MASAKPCPKCGTPLTPSGEKFVCAGCKISLVRKPKADVPITTMPTPIPPVTVTPILDFTEPAVVPLNAGPRPSHRKAVILSAAVLFFLLGTVLTGYAFNRTFSTSPNLSSGPVGEAGDPLSPPPNEDWRVTLKELRELVTTPNQLVNREDTPLTQPSGDPRTNQAIEKGVAFLKASVKGSAKGRYSASTAAGLTGLTLLECGVPKSDPEVQHLANYVRQMGPNVNATYQLATFIWFLDRLGDPKDRDLIRNIGLRLIAGQGNTGGWNYTVNAVRPQEEPQLLELLGEKPLAVNWRQQMSASPIPEGGPSKPGKEPPLRANRFNALPVFRWEPGKRYTWTASGHEDNSLTQFAILALWSARKHGVPVERSLAFAEARFRQFQNADGSWGYTGRSTARRDSMTCAGLLGLAVGRGLDKQSTSSGDVKDPAIEKALIYVGQIIGRKPGNPGAVFGSGRGTLIHAQAWGDLYFLWSLERMAVVWDLKTVAGKDWYSWGSKLLLDSQTADGSWKDAFAGVPDTCFALLFLKRVNVVQDLTAQLRLLGKVKDPGHAQPSVTLPGEVVKPDEP